MADQTEQNKPEVRFIRAVVTKSRIGWTITSRYYVEDWPHPVPIYNWRLRESKARQLADRFQLTGGR